MSSVEIEHTVWQVSGGTSDRSYADKFVNHGVALIGPGDSGPWSSDRSDEEFKGSFVRRFASELSVGDVLLLRTGISTIRAVGLIASDYQYLSQFDDVNGWDLQHGRRVRWFELPEPYDFGKPVFGANSHRFSRVQSVDVIAYAIRFVQSPPTYWQDLALPVLPIEEEPLGEPPTELQELVDQVNGLPELYRDPVTFGVLPTEDEMIGHFVIPFLRAMGWPVESIAVKWRNIDLTLFSELPRVPKHCCCLIEAKRLGAGFESALDQAVGYVSDLGILCDVVVTDGIRYCAYEATSDFEPVAYANLARLKQPSMELFKRMRRK